MFLGRSGCSAEGSWGSGGLCVFRMFPCSSSRWAVRSVEKGVFNSRKGFELRCPERRPRREVGREGATVTNAEIKLRDRGDGYCRQVKARRMQQRGEASLREGHAANAPIHEQRDRLERGRRRGRWPRCWGMGGCFLR